MGGDDSAVVVDLAQVPDSVAEVVLVLTMRREAEESLGQLSYVGCRVYDSPLAQARGTVEHEYCAFEVICSQLYGSNAVYLARLERLAPSTAPRARPATPTVRRRKCVDLSTDDGDAAPEVVALPRSHSSAALARSHRRRCDFDLSIDAGGGGAETERPGWRLVAAAEAVEGCTAAFAAYAVSVRAAPDVPRRDAIFRLGGAAEAQRSSDEKDLSEYPSPAGTGTPQTAPAPAATPKPLFHESDRRACAAPDDHYAGFVEYAIMRTIVAAAAADSARAVEIVPRDRRRTLVAPPRPVPPPMPRSRRRRRAAGTRGQSPSRCVVM